MLWRPVWPAIRGFLVTLGLGLAFIAVVVESAALTWTQGTSVTWTARQGPVGALLADGTVLTLGGQHGSSSFKNDVFRITPGSTTLEQVTTSAPWTARAFACAVTLLGTNNTAMIGGFPGTNNGGQLKDAWLSTDKGATFTQMSSSVYPIGRYFAGCVSVAATNIFVFGGKSAAQPVPQNDIRVSSDSGATWDVVDHSSCGQSPPMWTIRYLMAYTYMALLGRIVIAGGRQSDSVYHNDVWFSQSDAKCWTLAKADANSAVDGYHGAALLTVPFRGVEALLLMGGQNKQNAYLNTVKLSIDSGYTWSDVTGTSWSGRRMFPAVADMRNSRLLVWGGGASGTNYKGDLWSAPLQPIFDAMCYTYTSATTCTYEVFSNIACCGTQIIVVVDATVTTIAAGAFQSCTSIVSIDFTAATALTGIGASAFRDMSALTTLTSMKSATLLTSMGADAFTGCAALVDPRPCALNTYYDGAAKSCLSCTTVMGQYYTKMVVHKCFCDAQPGGGGGGGSGSASVGTCMPIWTAPAVTAAPVTAAPVT